MNNLFTKINKMIDAQKPPEGIVEVAEQLEVSSRLGLDVQDLAFVLADLVNDFVDTLVENWQNPSMGNVDLNDAKQALLVCNKLGEFVGSESKVIVEECIEKLKVFRIDLSSNLAHVQTPPQSPKPSNQPPPPPSDLYIIDKSLVKIEYPPKYTVTHGNLRTNIHYATYYEGIVCVKTYEFLDSIQNYEKAYNEIRIYERLSKLANNNNCFLLYYGTFIEGNKIYMVMEYYESNLMVWINYFETNNRWLEEDMFLKIAWKVLDSFNIMVQNGILHGDIKPQNMLADHNWNIKIIDFNASLTKIQEVALLNTGFHVVKGTLGYMAPELKAAFAVNQEKTNYNMEKSDVYSLGVVFYQLLTHQNIDELKADYMQAVIKNFQGFCNDTKNFLILLLTEDRHARPTFGEALASFKKIPATKTFTFSQQKST
jgi:serine/threonine protein kinase